MVPSADDKKYATDTRLFKDAVIQDGIFKNFESSPLIDQVLMKDICIYGAGTPKFGVTNPDPTNPADWIVMPDLNKLGKMSNRTSWDSFSYAIQMGHNVWSHINAVQVANQQYDQGIMPAMLSVYDSSPKQHRQFEHMFFKDIVDAIFATSNRGEADQLVEEYNRYWMSIIGTRGASGKKTVNASTQFAVLFDAVEDDDYQEDDSGLDEAKLDQLEEDVK
jgi:hypothetical protein